MEIIRHSDRCMVKNLKNSHIVEAAVLDFLNQKHLSVVINKLIKIHMTWNGKAYEGRAAGMDFESIGPEVYKSSTGIRG